MKLLFVFMAMFFCGNVFAQEVMPDTEFIALLVQSIGGFKGAGALAIAGIIVKLLLAAFNSQFLGSMLDKLTGKVKILIVTVLSIVSGIIALMVSGLPFGASLLHASILPMFLVFFNQIYKQFIEKKNEAPKLN